AEATRLERVRKDFLHLPCRKEEKEIDDKIREMIDFLLHPKGASLGGIENDIGEIPELTIPEVDSKTAQGDKPKAMEGTFGLVKKEVGKAAAPSDNAQGTLSGSESEGSFTFTYTGKPPADAHMTITATYSSPPAT